MSIPESQAAVTASDIVIAARGLTKRYGADTVVDAINFDIVKGEVFGLLGPNGAGKTTTILMMLGLTEISSGQVSVLGQDPVRAPRSSAGSGICPIPSASMTTSPRSRTCPTPRG
jgi:ABC-2 type transport system ATP-binding protein